MCISSYFMEFMYSFKCIWKFQNSLSSQGMNAIYLFDFMTYVSNDWFWQEECSLDTACPQEHA